MKRAAGFTLMEFLVVLAIVLVVLRIVFASALGAYERQLFARLGVNGIACAPHVRHFIVHARRAGQFVTPPLNYGVMRHEVSPVKPVLLVAAFALLNASDVHAETLPAVAVQGDLLSSLYGINDIDEAETDTERIRVYSMSLGEDFTREAQVLEVTANPRPYRKGAHVVLWNLGDVPREVDSVAVANDIITIRGSGDGGRRACRYELRFDGGVLSKQLEVLGCEAEP